jgi:hypothetical protein
LVQPGLLNSIIVGVSNIDFGRKGLAADGKEHEGRISYEKGILDSMTAFKEAEDGADPQTIVLAELVFLQQELQFCHERDVNTRSSLIKAVRDFEDALRSLEAVDEPGYKIAEKTYPQNSKYRYQGFPKDAFHTACIVHRTRISNILRSPGINMIEKAVLEQRSANTKTAQASYIQKQQAALE